jgi:hypothetical protein
MRSLYNIPVVVVAYNRPASLIRLLDSLDRAYYDQEVRLIISIDKSDTSEISKIANMFHWRHGSKEVIEHKENLGLRAHILFCGNLSENYDGVIVLEDDLYVSPGFYIYTMDAHKFFHEDKNIAGISLYSHNYNETAKLPFTPLIDDADSFFMQIPSSWGQCWSKEQWQEFSKWYESNKDNDITIESGLPENVVAWPSTSWKKYFYQYLISENKYFVYPRFSLSTNFGDPGVHFPKKLFFQQVPLLMDKRTFNFKSFSDSYVIYDSHCEILPDSINIFQPRLNDFDYSVDLYGAKSKYHVNSKYILTTKKCSTSILSFARDLKPMECNILNNIAGDDIIFTESSNCLLTNQSSLLTESQFFYFFGLRESQLRFDKQKYAQDESLLHSKIEIEKKSKQMVNLEEMLAQKDKLIKSIEQSYTFRIGKAILWPIKKLSGRG